jgi:hypothetical protein
MLIGACLFMLFGVHLWLAVHWYDLGLFTIDDGLFDADTLSNLTALAHGWARRSMVHPHLANLFSVPIRLTDLAVSAVAGGMDREHFRECLSLGISPLASLVATVAMYRTALLLTDSRRSSLLVAMLYATSFSMMIFGSIPEAFAVSNALIALLFWYFGHLAKSRSAGRTVVWVTLGFLIVSITITNAAVFGILRMLHQRYTVHDSWKSSVVRSGMLTAVVAIVAVGSGILAIHLLGYAEEAAKASVGNYIESFVSFAPSSIARNLGNFGVALSQTFFAFGASTRDLSFCAELTECRAVFFSQAAGSVPLLVIGLGALLTVTAVGWKDREQSEAGLIMLASLGILLFNVLLHSVFGTEMFLFSQHWMTPLTVLLVIRIHRAPRIGLGLLAVQVAVNGAMIAALPSLVVPAGAS